MLADAVGEVDVVVRGEPPTLLAALVRDDPSRTTITGDATVLDGFRRCFHPAREDLEAFFTGGVVDRIVGTAELGLAAVKSGIEGVTAESREQTRNRFLDTEAYAAFASRLEELTNRVGDVRRRLDELSR